MIKIKIIYSLLCSMLLISIFILIYLILQKYKIIRVQKKIDEIRSEKDKSYKAFNNYLKTKDGYFSYSRIEDYLKSMGNPMNFSPAGYIISKFLFAVIFAGLFYIITLNYFFCSIGAVVGYFILNFAFYESDKKDMKTIKIQLADVYDLISIQNAAGVFIGTVLTESYLIVENKRFKKALTELSAEINISKNIEKALDKFQKNFKSVDIDGFVMTIKQSLKTGQEQQLVEDMSNSLKDMNIITIQEETNKINRTKNIIQILMYIGILGIIVFGLGNEINNSWHGIFN